MFRILKDEEGFTAIELLIVIMALLILLSGATFAVYKLLPKAEVTNAANQVDDIKKASAFYYGDNRKDPKGFDDLVNAKLLSSTPDPNIWSLTCINQGALTVTMVAADNMAEIQNKLTNMCESVSADAATTKVTCVTKSNAYCP